MRETARWHDKVELQLDNRQLYFLFFGTAVAACLVFTVGVLVGKRLEAGARPVAAAGDPLAALDQFDPAATRTAPRAEAPSRHGATARKPVVEGGLTFHRALVDPKGKASPDPLAERPRGSSRHGAGARAASHDEGERAVRDRYVVQLRPLPSQSEAEALVRKLSASGYRPYLVASSAGGKSAFRVRLGEFPSKRAAETAKAEFEQHQRTIAFVSRVK
jgi:DedD protein